MAKKIRRYKVNRSYDGIDREESTAGLMALRILTILFIIAFITGSAALFAYNFQKETENILPSGVEQQSDSDGMYYQIYDSDYGEELISYCSALYPVSAEEEPRLYNYSDEIKVSELMEDSLERLVSAAAQDGIRLEIERGYMTHRECETYFRTLCLKFEDEGLTAAEAENRTKSIFPPAKENEYRTGMLIKLKNSDGEDFESTQTYKWLYKNGVNYGFINRYTPDKESITGVAGDLTVYRFAGTENAVKMRQFGMCLEEYYDYCKSRE